MRWDEIVEKSYFVLLNSQGILVEGNHIQQVKNAILVDKDFHTFLKLVQRIFGANNQEDNDYGKNFIASYDPIHYEQIKKSLKEIGLPFKEVSDLNMVDNELFPEDNNNKSPYPSNETEQKFW